MRARAVIVVALVLAACGPAVRNLVWPPPANPTMDGLYPYEFERRGIAGVKALHDELMGARFEDKGTEQTMLYALGRAQIDAFLFAMSLEADARAELLNDLGEMRGVEGASEETFLATPGILLEPLDILALKYPDSVYSTAAEDGRIAFRLLVYEGLGGEEMARIATLVEGREPMSPFMRGVVAIIVRDSLRSISGVEAGERSAEIVDRLGRFAGEKTGDRAADRERVLARTGAAVRDAGKDPDPLFIELHPCIEEARDLLESLPFPVGLPAGAALAERMEVRYAVDDPFRYIVVDATGAMRVATSVVLEVDRNGVVTKRGADGPFAWPGRTVADVSKLPGVLAEATEAVRFLEPAGGSPLWDRGAPLAVDPALPVEDFLPIMSVLRSSLDHVVVGVRVDKSAYWISADIRPNCAMAGTRLGAVMGTASIVVSNVTVGEEAEVSVTSSKGEDPLLIAAHVADKARGVLGKPRPDVFVEVAARGGQWTWGQLVAVHEGLLTAVSAGAEASEVVVAVQSFLLPEMTMAETRRIEVEASSPGLEPLPDPAGIGREELVLVGAYGDQPDEVLDAWLSAFLAPLPLDLAATVVLDVARCWGASYKERAVEALQKGKPAILEQVSTYLGDPVMHEVAAAVLSGAGSAAVPVLVRKLRSRDESVWMGAWNVLAVVDPGDVGPALKILLGDAEPELRIRALKLYGQSMEAGSHPELIPLLDDPDLLVRRWAIATCGMLQVEDAVPRLMEYASSSSTPAPILAEALFALGLLEVAEAVPLLLQGAGHSSAEVRSSAALALGNVGTGDVLDNLVGLLGDEDPTVVLGAVQSLGALGSLEATPHLEKLLDSPHAALAEAAGIAIERIRAVNVKDPATMDAASVVEACGGIEAGQLSDLALNPAPEAYDCLIGKLTSKDPAVRAAACKALGERGDPAAAAALKKRTKDKKPEVREAAWEALAVLDKIAKKGKSP